MGQYKKSTLTAAGERLVAQAIGGEIKLNITKVKTSNHQYPDGTNFKSLVDMDGIVQTMVGPKTAVYNDTLIQTRALFSNEEVKETYYIHNIGLYAMDGSEEVLFSISSATTPDEMPKYDGVAPTTCIYNIQNTISETSSVSLTINPAGYASIADIMELDEKKVDKTGDISETTINTLDEPATDVQFPVPVAGESTKTFLGKVKKFFEDTKNWMTGVCLIGQIVNNCVTNNDKLPLSAAQGKVLMDLYTVLNTNLINMSRTNAINGDIATFADNAPLNTFLRRRYEITNGTASGAPDAQDGYVEIHKTVSNDWIVIYAITNRGTVYTRAKTEGVWGAWTNCNDKLGVSIQRLEYRWDNQNPKLIVTDPNGYSAYVSLTKYQG
jgi:hypothetical protein